MRAFLPYFDLMRISYIYASILGLLEILCYWSIEEFKRTWEKSWQNKYNNPNTMKYCHYRALNSSSTDYLFKSSGKLQQLVEISKEYGIGLHSQ